MDTERFEQWVRDTEIRLIHLEQRLGAKGALEKAEPSITELVTGMRALLMHAITHLEKADPDFTVAGFRKTLFQAERAVLDTMSPREIDRWEQIIDLLLPLGRSRTRA